MSEGKGSFTSRVAAALEKDEQERVEPTWREAELARAARAFHEFIESLGEPEGEEAGR